ncbi:DTW domain-containing protein [Marinomonas piezotolerans]|uniref:tRNA-uridine aminocarboxypropyltransferase n=1 Tax=Marinomonas piezotolerans TaxID=2213058 RepID=A0A370U7W2_9GAMM|nr:tRNA-uridine aminocarboxypropyltransferase [Marinomonas piezotolerans]RDL43845.1 DTW domain-containing protein [Marinomonas piezotolerans]
MTGALPVNQRRTICGHCNFPQATCICDLIPHVSGAVNIWVLQDSLEIKHAKNTARLLALGYSRTHLIDVSDTQQLNTFFQTVTPENGILLYPDDRAVLLERSDQSSLARVRHLILLDGTWRKAKKMFFTLPKLHCYPIVKFGTPPASLYSIRKSPDALSLSTLEAAVYALELLSSSNDYQPIRSFFQQVISRQWSKQPTHHKYI